MQERSAVDETNVSHIFNDILFFHVHKHRLVSCHYYAEPCIVANVGFDRQSCQILKKFHQTEAVAEDVEEVSDKASYNYLLKMPIDLLTIEKVEELQV